jgi:hypothetical protein
MKPPVRTRRVTMAATNGFCSQVGRQVCLSKHRPRRSAKAKAGAGASKPPEPDCLPQPEVDPNELRHESPAPRRRRWGRCILAGGRLRQLG